MERELEYKMQHAALERSPDLTNVFHFLNEDDESLRLYKIAEDIGSGRLTQGIMFLELLSKAHKLENKLLLEHIKESAPRYFIKNINDIKDDREKANFVLKCLNCREFNNRLKRACKEKEYDNKFILFRRMLVNIFDDVVQGEFERKKYQFLLPYIKKLILTIKREI